MEIFPKDIYKYTSDDNNLPKVILIIGGPGCGKGTQCQRLKNEFEFIHISIGDVLREAREKDNEEGKIIDGYMQEFEKTGKLMPVDVTFHMLFRTMIDNGWNKKPFLIDGFIKDFTIIKKWDIYIRPIIDLKLVILMDCPIEVMRFRLAKRALTSDRKDEKISEIRIKTFIERTLPALDYFEKTGKLVKIDATGEINKVYENIVDNIVKSLY